MSKHAQEITKCQTIKMAQLGGNWKLDHKSGLYFHESIPTIEYISAKWAILTKRPLTARKSKWVA